MYLNNLRKLSMLQLKLFASGYSDTPRHAFSCTTSKKPLPCWNNYCMVLSIFQANLGLRKQPSIPAAGACSNLPYWCWKSPVKSQSY